LAYNSVKQQITYDGIKDYDEYWPKFSTMCDNKGLLNKLNLLLEEWEHLKRGEVAKDFAFVDINGESVSLSDFKGKWIYIDIWATWCSPCVAEIPMLKELEHSMRGQNIVFMSISVDQTQEPWKNMVVEKELQGVQLWAGQNEVIKDFYKVSGIPRFMIIDPQGNIYESSADRPSMGVGEKLSALLSEGI
jgi:thiol-disulfide isomerase/thioredoxin